jgi:hypothetical protein
MQDARTRLSVIIWVCALAVSLFLSPSDSSAQMPQCGYDRAVPSLDHARFSFRTANYVCAELELRDLLSIDTLDLKQKADAHVLLAAVYYAMLSGKNQQRDKALEQFSAAFKAYRDWKGELDIKSEDFQALMDEAKRRIEAQSAPPTGESPVTSEPAPQPTLTPTQAAKCPKSTAAWVSTGVFVASTAFFIYGTTNAGGKWSDYEDNPAHPQDVYDSYKSAVSTRNVAGIITTASGIVTTYLWVKYLSGRSGCKEGNQEYGVRNGLQVKPTRTGIALTYSF